MVQKAPRPGTPTTVVILRVLVVFGCGFIGLLGVVAGSLITDGCPSPQGCSQVERFALNHLPVQAVIALAGVVASLRFTQPRRQIGALVASLAVSPVAAVIFHFMVEDYMKRLPGSLARANGTTTCRRANLRTAPYHSCADAGVDLQWEPERTISRFGEVGAGARAGSLRPFACVPVQSQPVW